MELDLKLPGANVYADHLERAVAAISSREVLPAVLISN